MVSYYKWILYNLQDGAMQAWVMSQTKEDLLQGTEVSRDAWGLSQGTEVWVLPIITGSRDKESNEKVSVKNNRNIRKNQAVKLHSQNVSA